MFVGRCNQKMKHLFNNTGVLSWFILRRDRIRIPIWIIAFVGITVAIAISFTDLYGTVESRQAMAQTVLNPAMTALIGPGYGIDNYTLGAMMAHQMLLLTAIVVGMMKDRKSTRLNSSHVAISYAVFFLINNRYR